jgi:nucleoside-diphosphate-sugar epimerase
MRIALTGGTGFLGRYIANHLTAGGHTLRAWYRDSSDRGGFDASDDQLTWIPGELGERQSADELVKGTDAVVHSALFRPGAGFRGAEGDVVTFAQKNILGTLHLVEAARAAGVPRFIFISTCAVHERILDDRKLDEAHPLWPNSHYGAHKAAIEKFVHSYGLGGGYNICSLRPTGIYGLARPASDSRWFDLVQRVARGETVEVSGGGKEVHAADVARAVAVLLTAEGTAGQAYNCYDRYISAHEVATLAKEISGSNAKIVGEPKTPKHQIETGKLRALGMEFGGEGLLRETVGALVAGGRDGET